MVILRVCVFVCVCVVSDDSFVIPELPSGQELVVNILSTWGDKHYVGLTSLQVFAVTGEQVQVKKVKAANTWILATSCCSCVLFEFVANKERMRMGT